MEVMKRTIQTALVLTVFTMIAASLTIAQTSSTSDQSSLGDYARKVQKAPVAKAKPKVFDNDNLPTDEKVSVVGTQTASNTGDNAAAGDSKSASGDAAKPEDDPAKKQAEWKEWQDKLTGQKNAIDLASRELDVLQKEYQLRAAAMYADVGNRLRNSADWDKQDADYKQKIADKQKAVDDAKQKLDDMQEDARKAGVPAGMRDPQ
jgi:hypothetical protein